MKVPYSWLRELVDVTASPADVAVAMGVRGFAVEGLESLPDGDTVLDFEVTANRPDCTVGPRASRARWPPPTTCRSTTSPAWTR